MKEGPHVDTKGADAPDGWTRLPASPCLKELQYGVVIRAGANWYASDWNHFAQDATAPWLKYKKWSFDVSTPVLLHAVLIMLDAKAPDTESDKRQHLWPARVTKALRLLRYVPALSLRQTTRRAFDARQSRSIVTRDVDAGVDVWQAPLAIFTWLPRAAVVSIRPDLTFLLAPSVKFFLPYEFDGLRIHLEAKNITPVSPQEPLQTSSKREPIEQKQRASELRFMLEPSSERELERFFLGDLTTEAADRHNLGNDIGPLIISRDLGMASAPPMQSQPLPPAALVGIYYQQFLGRRAPGAEQFAVDVETHIQRVKSLLGTRKVLILDDDIDKWGPIWNRVLGTNGWAKPTPDAWERLLNVLRSEQYLDPVEMQLMARWAADHCLIVVDLRILKEESEPSWDRQKELSGFKLIRAILKHGGARGSMVPIVAFSSSQLQENERRALSCGADAFLSKPIRFDQEDSQRLLRSIELYLHPSYRILAEIFFTIRKEREKVDSGKKELIQLGDDLLTLIQSVRDTVGGSLDHGGLRPRGAPDSAAISRSTELAFDAYRKTFLAQFASGKAIVQFRNIASHGQVAYILRESGPPLIGLAILYAAQTLFQCACHGIKPRRSETDQIWSALEYARTRTGKSRNHYSRPDIEDEDDLKALASCAKFLKQSGIPQFLKPALDDLTARCDSECNRLLTNRNRIV